MSAGVVYVELDLDYNRFERNEKKLEDSSRKTAVTIEKNYQHLGKQGAEYYQKMVEKIIADHQKVINSDKYAAVQKAKAYTDAAAWIRRVNDQAVADSDRIAKQNKENADWWLAQMKNQKEAHGFNMKGMIRNVLALYAAYYVFSGVLRTIVGQFEEGLRKSDQMKTSAIAVAASLTTAQGNTENYRKNYQYASDLVLKLREVDKTSFATYENILLMNRAMSLQGVILDTNNKKQMDTFTSLTNAIALYTAGQDQGKQASQEMRSIFSGNIKAGSEVARIIDIQAKKSGQYANGLKDILKMSKDQGEVLERIQPFLSGIEASVKDIANTWESATTSLQTSTDLLKIGMSEALFPDAVNTLKDIANWIDDIRKPVSMFLRKFHDRLVMIDLVLKSITPEMEKTGKATAGFLAKMDQITDYPFKVFRATLYATNEEYRKLVKNTLDFEQAFDGWKPLAEGEKMFDYKEMKQVTDEFGKMYWYVKSLRETPTTPPGQEQVLANLKAQIRAIDQRRAAAKDAYQEAIRHAETVAKIARRNGQYELETTKQLFEAKSSANEILRSTMLTIAGEEVKIREEQARRSETEYDIIEERANKTLAIESEYRKNLSAFRDDRLNQEDMAAQKMIDTEAYLKKTLMAYSRESYDAQIADIRRKFLEHHRYAKQTEADQKLLMLVLQKVEDQFTATFEAGKAGQRMTVLDATSPYSKEAYQAFLDSVDAQADLMKDSFQSASEMEAWKTSKILDEIATRAEAQRVYYEDIKGFEGAAYDFAMERIEAIRQADIARGVDIKAANQKAYQASMEAVERRYDAEHADILKVMGATESMFGNAKALMKEDSDAYKISHNAEMAMKAAQIAIEVQKQLTIASSAAQEAAVFPMKLAMRKSLALAAGVEATVSAGTGDPYTAPARMAAMAAAVAGVLSIIGIGFSAFGGSGGSSVNPNAYNEGKGSLLGSSEASESAARVYELLKDAHAMEYVKLVGIYNEVRNLNTNITGLVRGLLLGGDFSQMGDVTGAKTMLSNTQKVLKNSFKNFEVFFAGLLPFGEWASNIAGSVLGGKTKVSQIGAGIEVSGATMGEILSGANAGVGQFFSDMKKVVDGGWFHSDKTTYWTIFEELDAGTNRLLTNVFVNLGNTMLMLAEGFDMDVTEQLMAMSIDLGKIDLMGKTGDEISDTITAAFSKYGDELVESLFGAIVTQYQKVNEGLLETATRLLLDKERVMRMLDYTNQGFDVSIESAIELSESLISLAGDLDTLTDSFSAYYNAFFTDSEKAIDEQNLLYESLTAVGLYLPSTRDGFRALVESLDLTTMSGQSAYVAMLSLAETADSYYSYLEEIQQEALDNMKDRVSDWESALRAIQQALGPFTEVTASSAIMAIDDIMAQTKQGILVSSNQLSEALSRATSVSTATYATGVSYDLDQARIRASLVELEAATADQLSYDELRLSLMEGQSASLEELVMLTQETNGLLSGDVTPVTGPLTSQGSAANLITEIRELKTLIKETGEVNALYVKRLSDHLDDWDGAGLPETRS